MDPSRFDALVQSLAASHSRRRLFGGVLAGAVAPLTAAAKGKHHRKSQRCLATGKRCAPSAADAAAHRSGQARAKGRDQPKGIGKGKRHAPSCARCCTDFAETGADGKSHCACKDDGQGCSSSAECCGGDCRAGTCSSCPSPCASGQRCKDEQCVCDGESCPNGCCQGQTCQTGRSSGACGSGGEACQACGPCNQCSGNRCVAGNEGQCCDGRSGVCRSGQCVDCPSGQECSGEGTCVCDGRSCPDGCCDRSNVCRPGTSDEFCGVDGDFCQPCQAPLTCGGGDKPRRCGCTDESADITCAGKCGTVRNNCGHNIDCTAHCAGCCSGATCLAGMDDGACGVDGGFCQVCQPPMSCGGAGNPGKCDCAPTSCAAAGKTCGTIDDGCGHRLNCGACDANQCLTCGSGNTCVSTCGAGETCCFGSCVNTNSNPGNCRACGRTCPRRCVGGFCF